MQNNSSYYNKRAIEAIHVKVQGLENQIKILQSKIDRRPKLIQPIQARFNFSANQHGGNGYRFIYYEDGEEKYQKIDGNISYAKFELVEPTNLQATSADLDIQNGYILRTNDYKICDIKGSNIYYVMTKKTAGQHQDNGTPLYEQNDILRFNTETKTITKVQNPASIFGNGFASSDFNANNIFYVYFESNGINNTIYITDEIAIGINPTEIEADDIRCLRVNKIGDAEFGVMFETRFNPSP